ncbi:GNAT family N-acetyltransferase [Mycobacterium sp. 3519A]|uniref:GNAT family N-acetyltransferase n=1 Tax=Mycobacterium sp. 3519A TaxID=2057184 RepID=UPI0011595759|nr:GNAT family N-acetyltransferase [Mycobacterium sp. 3519A]
MTIETLGMLAEQAEAEFMYQYLAMASAETKARLGISTTRIGGGVAVSMRHDVTKYWSKALGFGITEPVSAELIDEIVDFYRGEQSSGAVIQIAPHAIPADWDEICARHGFTLRSSWFKLACDVNQFRPGTSELRVTPVSDSDAAQWASVTLQGFEMPEEQLLDMFVASAQHPNFRPYAAWDDDTMVAAANLYIHGAVGSFNADATLPSHRNRGAQSAMLAVRASEAASAGCRWLVAETGRPAPGATNPSLDNMLRSGLQPMYLRHNWAWTP